ncbi:Uncharacterised protein [Mycobacteroides abscessus subsp. abscessus]|nr:Uncharacterised protein [Mycobacteroides abscessus subsp. abscessus]
MLCNRYASAEAGSVCSSRRSVTRLVLPITCAPATAPSSTTRIISAKTSWNHTCAVNRPTSGESVFFIDGHFRARHASADR